MGIKIDAVQEACRAVSVQMRDYTRDLQLSFIVHSDGEKREALSLAGQELLSHPGGEAAMRLMRDEGESEAGAKNQYSTYLGLITWQENGFMGLVRRCRFMALNTINTGQFESMRTVRAQAWHMAWHAISHLQLREDPDYQHLFDSGIVRPMYDATTTPSANLRADIFSALISGLEGDLDAVRRIAQQRCADSLSCRSGHYPEHYPFALAQEATQVAMTDLLQHPPSKKRQIHESLALADKIAREFPPDILNQWTSFCAPAQEMAWRGDAMDVIVGAAVCTSQDTYIRTTGFLVSDMLHLTPVSALALEDRHSPFAEDRYNQRLHRSMIERAFEKAAGASVLDRSGAAFISAAHEQNKALCNGHIFGWCAAALQAAGNAFDNAITSGSKNPIGDALQRFEQEQHKTTWDSLKELSGLIISRYRGGYAVTFSDILEFCGPMPGLAGVSSAVTFTMKDPSFLKKRTVANDTVLRMGPAFGPAAAMPRAAAAPATPTPQMAAAAPSPSGAGAPIRQKIVAKPATEEDAGLQFEDN